MANLIITVIAIALVAVASLMGAYYGGSAFLNNQSAANASTIMNEGQQLAGAWQAYLNDNNDNVPASMDALVTNNYLGSFPVAPVAAGYSTNSTIVLATATPSGGSLGYYVFISVGANGTANDNVCQRILHTATGASITTTVPTAASANVLVTPGATGPSSFGCGQVTVALTGTAHAGATASTAINDYVAYYKLQ